MPSIRINDATKQRLQALKKVYGVRTYNEVILRVTEREFDTPKSMFGSLKGIRLWTKADRMTSKYD